MQIVKSLSDPITWYQDCICALQLLFPLHDHTVCLSSVTRFAHSFLKHVFEISMPRPYLLEYYTSLMDFADFLFERYTHDTCIIIVLGCASVCASIQGVMLKASCHFSFLFYCEN